MRDGDDDLRLVATVDSAEQLACNIIKVDGGAGLQAGQGERPVGIDGRARDQHLHVRCDG